MRCLNSASKLQQLKVVQHKYKVQQSWIDRAEEDLLCAFLLCKNKTSYSPHANICYFLHQTIEKWLKAYMAINGLAFRNTHELFFLLQQSGNKDPIFLGILQRLDQYAPIVLTSDFSSNILRYGSDEDASNIQVCVSELFPVAFQVRRLVKKSIRRLSDET